MTTTDIDEAAQRRGPNWPLLALAAVAGVALVALAALFVTAATADDENVVLTRNEVARDAAGAQVWRGGITNVTDERTYTDVTLEVLLLDATGKTVGKASGRAERLSPGQGLDVQAPLPAEATAMQISAIHWRGENASYDFGPYKQHPFGYVHQ